jgi:hypothetical protein
MVTAVPNCSICCFNIDTMSSLRDAIRATSSG